MPLAKKIIFSLLCMIVLCSSFSGCIFENLLGTSFSLVSWRVCNDNGFPGVNITFSCSGSVTVKLVGPDSFLLDSDSFFKGGNNKVLYLAEYRNSVTAGIYNLKVYDTDNKEIFTQSFTFSGADLNILDCEQKWWKRDSWIDSDYSLFGLRLTVENNGDVPAYPYNVVLNMDSVEDSNLALPVVIMPGESKNVDCFVYRKYEPENNEFTVDLEDNEENTLGTGTFLTDVQDNVPVTQFSWQYGGHRRPNIPEPEYLYEYYSSLDRINNEDYGLYVFDPYDDKYIDVIIECIMFAFTQTGDVDKINYVASFVQNLEYKSDSATDSSYEYPNYPVETLFTGSGGGDCEDKAILTASLLYNMGYDVALLRLPNHMAVGVSLSEEAIPGYGYYTDSYYFLETTTPGKSCGFIPNEYTFSDTEVTAYPISSRALITHNWEGDSVLIYTNTELGDFVKVVLFVENLGTATADSVKVIAGFYKISDLRVMYESETIPSIVAGGKKKLIITVEIPQTVETWFKTRIYYNGEFVDEKESISSFPTT